jgi:hypothetical protein
VVLELLRSLLIDWALDTRNEEMFRNLVSPNWEQFVVGAEEKVTPCKLWTKTHLVLWDRKTGRIAALRLAGIAEQVVVAVSEDEWDERGWRDPYGFTLYDRLRSAGFKVHAMWIPAEAAEFQRLVDSYRVIHPRQLVLQHPARTLTVLCD